MIKGAYRSFNIFHVDKSPTERLVRERNREAELMLDEEQLRLLRHTVPVRGTEQWNRREAIRERIGCKCVCMDQLQ